MLCWVGGCQVQAGVGGQHVPGCSETQEMDGWKACSKMLVSVLPAVNISTQTESTAPAGSKGKHDLHIKSLLGGCLRQHLQRPSDPTMLHVVSAMTWKDLCIYFYT